MHRKKSECVTPNEERGLSTYCKTKISHFVRNDKQGVSRLFTRPSILDVDGDAPKAARQDTLFW